MWRASSRSKLDEVEEHAVTLGLPEDLARAFAGSPAATALWPLFPKSTRYGVLA
jgi:hypothetical protein